MESEVSVLVLSLEAPMVGGRNAARDVAAYCETIFQEQIEDRSQSFSALMQSQGGAYRILCHRQMVQVGLFLPQSFDGAGDFALAFLKKFQSRWQGWSFGTGLPMLDDQIYERIIQERVPTKSPARLSVHVKGPLRSREDEILRLVRQIQPREEPSSSTSAPDQFFNASSPPSLVCLAEWDGPEAESLTKAQFASELLDRTGLPGGVRKDILSFPGRAFLEVIATAPLDRVCEFQTLGEGIKRVISRPENGESWAEFVDLRRQLTNHDRRDLFKAAFQEAWQSHFHVDFSEQPASMSWNPPTSFHQWLCLPDARFHQSLCDVTREPRTVALRLASGTDVEIAVILEHRKISTAPSLDWKNGLSAFEDLAISVIPLSESEVLLQTHVGLDGLANLLATLRAVFLESFLRSELGAVSASFPADLNTAGSKWNVTIAAVGPYPPYVLLNSLRKGWPAFSGPPRTDGNPLGALSRALDISTFTPELLQGRWQLYTSNEPSLARTIARFVAFGGHLRDLPGLLKTP